MEGHQTNAKKTVLEKVYERVLMLQTVHEVADRAHVIEKEMTDRN